jgi:hypothetical protein
VASPRSSRHNTRCSRLWQRTQGAESELEGQTSPALVALIRVGLRGVTSLASEGMNIAVRRGDRQGEEPHVAGDDQH